MWDPNADMPFEERLRHIEKHLPLLTEQVWKWEGAGADVAWLLKEIRVAREQSAADNHLVRLTFDTLLKEAMSKPIGPKTVGEVLRRLADLGFDVASVVLQDDRTTTVVTFRDGSTLRVTPKT